MGIPTRMRRCRRPASERATAADVSPQSERVTPGSADSWRWWGWWHGCLVFLGITTGGLAIIGFFDLVKADDIVARSTGLAVLILALLTLVAIGSAWPTDPTRRGHRKYPWLGGTIAASVLLMTSISAFTITFPPRQDHQMLVIAVSLLVAEAAVVTLVLGEALRRWLTRGVRIAERPRNSSIVSSELIAAGATIVAALVALPLAWYSAYYVPAHTEPSVSLQAELTDVNTHGTQGAVTVRIKIENTGATGVRLLGSMYTLLGAKISAVEAGNGEESDGVEPTMDTDDGPAARNNTTTQLSPPILIQSGLFVDDQSVLLPDESTEASIVAFFPAREFDVLRVGADLLIARDDRVAIVTDAVSDDTNICAGRRVLVREWPIVPGSIIEELINSRQEVVLGRVVEDSSVEDSDWWSPVPYLVHQVQRERETCDHLFDGSGGLEDSIMAGYVGDMGEILVPPVLAPAPR